MKELREKALINKNYEQYLCLFDSTQRLSAYFKIENLLNDEEKIKLFRYSWLNADLNYKTVNKCKETFLKFKTSLMNRKERRKLELLPSRLTIYRGTRVDLNDKGISWTLRKSVAKNFANSVRLMFFEKFKNGKPLIKSKQISKDDVICLFTERGEDEIIYLEKE